MSQKKIQSDEIFHLGTYRESYTPRVAPGRVMLGSAIFCGVLCVLEFVTATNKYFSPPYTILSDRYRKDSILIAAILGLFFLLLTVILGALYYTHKKHRVDLYEQGFVVVTWHKSISFSWFNIKDFQVMPIYGRSRKPVNWDFTITRNDGVKAQFRGLKNLETLGHIIKREIIYLKKEKKNE